jgi:PTS system ascorbate-specific IIA component
MVGLLIVAHGTLGQSLIDCAEYVLGRIPDRLAAMDLMTYGDCDAMLGAAARQLAELDAGDGVLVLTDIYGATPSNTVCRLVDVGHVDVVSGVNLPMLLKAVTYREETLPALAERVARGGQDGIFHVEECSCHAGG